MRNFDFKGEFGGFCSSVKRREKGLCVQVKKDKEEDNGSVVIFVEGKLTGIHYPPRVIRRGTECLVGSPGATSLACGSGIRPIGHTLWYMAFMDSHKNDESDPTSCFGKWRERKTGAVAVSFCLFLLFRRGRSSKPSC